MDPIASTSKPVQPDSNGPRVTTAWPWLAGLASLCVGVAVAQDAQAPTPGATAQAESEEQLDEPQAPSEPPIPAVWKERRVSFTYGSTRNIYSCNALADRVASLMRAVGARDDVKVRVSNCSNDLMADPRRGTPGADPAPSMTPASDRYRYQVAIASSTRQVPTVYITAMLPVEVTDEVRAELEKDKSKRELIARATGNPAARFNDPIPFAAHRRRATLSNETVGIEPEECELVDEMTTSVLPRIDVRIVSRTGTLCQAGSQLPPQVVVEGLMPVQYENSGVFKAPEDDGTKPPPGDDEKAKERDTAEPPAR
jgi:hypothetical protein